MSENTLLSVSPHKSHKQYDFDGVMCDQWVVFVNNDLDAMKIAAFIERDIQVYKASSYRSAANVQVITVKVHPLSSRLEQDWYKWLVKACWDALADK